MTDQRVGARRHRLFDCTGNLEVVGWMPIILAALLRDRLYGCVELFGKKYN
jgi:hypothetical protein